jgi:hypothetical protein
LGAASDAVGNISQAASNVVIILIHIMWHFFPSIIYREVMPTNKLLQINIFSKLIFLQN